MSRRIPISAAKRIAREFDQSQVILLTFDRTTGKTHVVTYGKSIEDCKQASDGGNRIKKWMGWPPEMCNTVPSRIKSKNSQEVKG